MSGQLFGAGSFLKLRSTADSRGWKSGNTRAAQRMGQDIELPKHAAKMAGFDLTRQWKVQDVLVSMHAQAIHVRRRILLPFPAKTPNCLQDTY